MQSKELTVYQSNATIEKLERARLHLAECKTLEEVKRIRDVATAARVYAKAAHLCRDAQQFAAEITLTASRKAGEILKQLDKTPAGGDRRSDQAASVAACSEYSRTLEETATPERTARYWQQLAEVSEETVKRYVADVRKTDKDISASGLLQAARLRTETEQPSRLDTVFAKLATFSSESFLGQVPALIGELEAQPISDEQSRQTLAAILTALDDIGEKATLYRSQLEKFRIGLRAA